MDEMSIDALRFALNLAHQENDRLTAEVERLEIELLKANKEATRKRALDGELVEEDEE